MTSEKVPENYLQVTGVVVYGGDVFTRTFEKIGWFVWLEHFSGYYNYIVLIHTILAASLQFV